MVRFIYLFILFIYFNFFSEKNTRTIRHTLLERMVHLHSSTRLMDKICDVDYEG